MLKSSAIIIGFLISINSAMAQQVLNLVPPRSSGDWSLFVNQGCTEGQICGALNALVMASLSGRPNLCDLMETSEVWQIGFNFPEWQTEDYRDHLAEIKQHSLSFLLVNERLDAANDESLREARWSKYKVGILAAFERGTLIYQTTSFDVDNDGEPEQLHRISSIVLDPDGEWHPRACGTIGAMLYGVYLDRPGLGADAVPGTANYFQALGNAFKEDGRDLILLQYRDRSYWFQTDDGHIGWASMLFRFRSAKSILLPKYHCWTGIIHDGRIRPHARSLRWPEKVTYPTKTESEGCGK